MIPLVSAVFLASLLGSLHCAGMCGAFVTIALMPTPGDDRTPQRVLQCHYHVGRLITYVILGVVAGSLGAAVNVGGRLAGVQQAAALLAAASMIVFGAIVLLRTAGARLPRVPLPGALRNGVAAANARAMRFSRPRRALALGLLTTLLPCGWLYAFVLTAAGTGSPLEGSVVMAAFWTGTVPVLASVGAAARTMGGVLGRQLPLITSACLIAVGSFMLTERVMLIGRDLSPNGWRPGVTAWTALEAAGKGEPECCRDHDR